MVEVDLGLQPLNIDLELLADQLNIDQYLIDSKNTESNTTTTNHPSHFRWAPIKLTLVQSLLLRNDD